MQFESIKKVLQGFYEDLRLREGSRRSPGGSPGRFSEGFGGFEEVFEGSEWVWNGFMRFSKLFATFLEDFRRVRGRSAP